MTRSFTMNKPCSVPMTTWSPSQRRHLVRIPLYSHHPKPLKSQFWGRSGTCFALQSLTRTWDSRAKGETWRQGHAAPSYPNCGHTFLLPPKHQHLSNSPRPGPLARPSASPSSRHSLPLSLGFFSSIPSRKDSWEVMRARYKGKSTVLHMEAS